MSRVIAIGLDAAEATLLERCVSEGRLPHLARLRERAATVDLTSPTEYRAEFPWGAFVTGRRPESLRYWGTVEFDPAHYDAYMRGAPDTEPFYAMHDEATVIAFDVPKVIRSPAVHGVQILGWGAHSPQYPVGSCPAGELDAVVAEFGPHPGLQVEYDGAWHQGAYLEEFGKRQVASIRTRSRILPWLTQRTPDWDLLVTLVGETHQLGHMTWHGFEGRLSDTPTAGVARTAMLDALIAIDELVGDVMAWAPDDAVIIVFTVHGMTHADDETAGSLLAEILLRTSTGEARFPVADLGPWRRRGAPPIIPGTWDSPGAWAERRFRADHRTARRAGRRAYLRQHAERRAGGALRLRRRLLGREALRPDPVDPPDPNAFPLHDDSINDWAIPGWYRDAWPRMPAFVIPGFSDAHIRINLATRERDGIVAPDDYDRACAEIERVVRGCRHGITGEPLVLDITRMRTGDPWEPTGASADLVVRLVGAEAIEHADAGAVGPLVTARTGGHTTHGLAYLAGPGITPGPRGTRAVNDLSATVTALLGARSGPHLDGQSFLNVAEPR